MGKDKKVNIFLVSDTHYGHSLLSDLGTRPVDFSEKLYENMQKTLKKDDILVHLGDICIGSDTFVHKKYIQSLPCRKILVKGNHDRKSDNYYLRSGWDFVCKSFVKEYYGLNVLFTHMPQIYDVAYYDMNIHGHLHENNHRGCTVPYDMMGRRYALISMEALHYMPITLDTVMKKTLDKRK